MKKSLLTAALATAATLLAAGGAQAQSATYVIDPTHTFVNWEALHFGTSTSRGRFDKKEGSISFDRAGRTGKVDVTIDMTSISTGVAPFDRHLRSADFFDAEKHPTARFVSERMVFSGDNVSEVVGTLTMRGVTHPVTLKASRFNCYQNPFVKREACGGDFETVVKRSLFGSTFGLPGIPDDIKLSIQVEAIKQ